MVESFDIVGASVISNIKWVRDVLIKALIFNNLLVKALINDYFNDKTIIIDATETPIQRPKKE
ncbi:hypothetical protein [Spiroplasma poulsonii]|uniref:hypothetical protein n=1 Tax=Spiroplasma poulsonii TaxID=2138 RepID=UPI001F4C732B|nr:hypothetical protein [Spiroplasma poulsonii]UNF62316.1 hypothetical protein MNU24_02310 [Spiroplasma poulsonii]